MSLTCAGLAHLFVTTGYSESPRQVAYGGQRRSEVRILPVWHGGSSVGERREAEPQGVADMLMAGVPIVACHRFTRVSVGRLLPCQRPWSPSRVAQTVQAN